MNQTPKKQVQLAALLRDEKKQFAAIRDTAQKLGVSPQPWEAIDDRAGCSNGPELVAELRHGGLEVPCQRIPCIDSDGFIVERGIYFLTARDMRFIRDRILVLKAQRQQGGGL